MKPATQAGGTLRETGRASRCKCLTFCNIALRTWIALSVASSPLRLRHEPSMPATTLQSSSESPKPCFRPGICRPTLRGTLVPRRWASPRHRHKPVHPGVGWAQSCGPGRRRKRFPAADCQLSSGASALKCLGGLSGRGYCRLGCR